MKLKFWKNITDRKWWKFFQFYSIIPKIELIFAPKKENNDLIGFTNMSVHCDSYCSITAIDCDRLRLRSSMFNGYLSICLVLNCFFLHFCSRVSGDDSSLMTHIDESILNLVTLVYILIEVGQSYSMIARDIFLGKFWIKSKK